MKFGPVRLNRHEKTWSLSNTEAERLEDANSSENIVAAAALDDKILPIAGNNLAQKEKVELQESVILGEVSEAHDIVKDSDGGRFEKMSRLTGATMQKLSPIGRAGKFQLNSLKEEGNDLKKLMSSKEIILYKTDAIAVMIRKYGGFIEFLEDYDKLIREGYVLDHSEAIESFFEIPIAGIKTKLGKLYYFHHRKYTTMTPPPEPEIIDSPHPKRIATVFSPAANLTVGSKTQ